MFKKFIALALAVGPFAFAGEYWHLDPGGVTMKFLSMPVAPRAAALSGAGVADPGRVSEVSRNPLAMSVAKDAEFGLSQVIFGEGGKLGPNIFQVNITMDILAQTIADFAIKCLDIREFGIMSPLGDFGTSMSENFTRAVERRGGEVVAFRNYEEGRPDYKTEFNREGVRARSNHVSYLESRYADGKTIL